MKIEVLPPHANASDWEFVPEGKTAIRFGLGAVKGVGEAGVRALAKLRRESGEFTSFEDMCMRLPPKSLNKRMLEAMVKAGALDGLIPHAHAALEGLSEAMGRAARKRHDLEARQSALFEAAEPEAGDGGFPKIIEWSLGERLRHEKEVLGFYLSGHPLEEYLGYIDGLWNANLESVSDMPDGATVVLPLTVTAVRTHRGARGTMAFVQVGDLFGSAEMVCFSNLYTEVVEFLEGEQALLAMLRVDRSRDELSLIAEALAPLDTVLAQQVRRVCISTHALAWDAAAIERFADLARSNPGDVAVHFHLHLANGATAELSSGLTLCWNEEVKNRLRDWFDENAVQLLCKSWQPVVAPRQGGRKQERRQYAA